MQFGKQKRTRSLVAVLSLLFFLSTGSAAFGHGLSDVIGLLTIEPADAKPGDRVELTVRLQETEGAKGKVDMVNVALDLRLSLPGGEDYEKALLPSGPATFSESFIIGEGFHDVRVNLHHLTNGREDTALLGFSVGSTLIPLTGSDQEVWFSPAGTWAYFPILDNMTAVLVALIGLVLIVILYRKPAAQANGNELHGSTGILFLMALAMTLPGFGAYWDVSWHSVSFRESIVTPSHLLIVSGIVFAIWAVMRTILKGKKSAWREHIRKDRSAKIALLVLSIPLLAGPLDELWHTQFGVDASLWAPPHIIFTFGMVAAGLLMASMKVERESMLTRGLRILILAGVLFTSIIFLTEHEFPFPSWHASSRRPFFVYPGFLTIFTLVVSLMAKRVVQYRFGATLVVGSFVSLRLLVSPFLIAIGRETLPRFPLELIGTFLIALSIDWIVKGRFVSAQSAAPAQPGQSLADASRVDPSDAEPYSPGPSSIP